MPSIAIHKLADLKRALALPGLMVRMTQCDAGTERHYKPEALVAARAGRRIHSVRSKDFIFEGKMPGSAGAYLYFGKASDWEFNGTHVVTCRDRDISGFFMTYALTIEPDDYAVYCEAKRDIGEEPLTREQFEELNRTAA